MTLAAMNMPVWPAAENVRAVPRGVAPAAALLAHAMLLVLLAWQGAEQTTAAPATPAAPAMQVQWLPVPQTMAATAPVPPPARPIAPTSVRPPARSQSSAQAQPAKPAQSPASVVKTAAAAVQPVQEPVSAAVPATAAMPISTPTVAAEPVAAPTPAAAADAVPAPPTSPQATPARFDAAYLNNPEPVYPPASRVRAEEGVVRLRVWVGSDGKPQSVEVVHSSGHSRLDRAAQTTVQQQWRFVPAKRGAEAVAGSVIVPISFSLQ